MREFVTYRLTTTVLAEQRKLGKTPQSLEEFQAMIVDHAKVGASLLFSIPPPLDFFSHLPPLSRVISKPRRRAARRSNLTILSNLHSVLFCFVSPVSHDTMISPMHKTKKKTQKSFAICLHKALRWNTNIPTLRSFDMSEPYFV